MKKERKSLPVPLDYEPSEDVLYFCKKKGYTKEFVDDEKLKFILRSRENGTKYKLVHTAFRNWLDRAKTYKNQNTISERKGSQSFREYKPKN